jgi:iron complex outermembrane receptor protein
MKKLYIWIVLLSLNSFVFAQNTDSLAQISLQEVKIFANPIPKYNTGAKIISFDSLTLSKHATQNIGELLMNSSGIYIKQYGAGMLSTPAFRGTSASHTAVLWNGININSLSLGQSDLSSLLVGNQQNIALHFGAASALYGTDAIGGSIHINSEVDFSKRQKIHFQQVIGSFGLRNTHLQSQISNGKIESKTSFYTQFQANNFPFQNITLKEKPIEIQQNAAWHTQGIQQEINFAFTPKKYISTKIWYQERNLQIQPTMNANQDIYGYKQQFEDNLRILTEFVNLTQKGNFNIKTAYLFDNFLYEKTQKTATHRGILQGKYERNLNQKMSLQLGFHTLFIQTDVEAYQENHQEIRNDFFVLWHYQIKENLKISTNLRQAFLNEQKAPVSPSLGLEWTFLEKENQFFTFKTNHSYNFRFPTLNDRYWYPNGNRNLRSENGWSSEIGFSYQIKKNNWQFNTSLTAFEMWIKDWILWQNQGNFWTPNNVRKVNSRGLESDLNLIFRKNNFYYSFKTGYTFTQSLNIEQETTLNPQFHLKQLPYTPLHRAFAQMDIGNRAFSVGTNIHYTSLRFETLDNQVGLLTSLPAFWLCNVHLQKSFLIQKHSFDLTFKINNILDAQYQNYMFRAMQGRNFSLHFQYQLH